MEVVSMTLREYRARLAWSMSELARRAGLTYQTVSRIEKGELTHFHTVAAIANALAAALGENVTVDDLKGVHIIS